MSTYSVNFLKNIKSLLQIPGEDPPDVQFKEQGYLLLADEYSAGVMEENHKLHRWLIPFICIFSYCLVVGILIGTHQGQGSHLSQVIHV